MIVVIGTALAQPHTLAAMQELALAHVQRSRTEPGCLSHEVAMDLLQPLQLTFTERWADAATLAAHFRLDASRQFGRALGQLAAQPPGMTLYETQELSPAELLARG